MEFGAGSSMGVCDPLQNILLEEEEGATEQIIDRVLIRKILSVRPFRRFTIGEIIKNMWRTKAGVNVEGIADNTFKFAFALTEDKEVILKNKPWNLNGAHLVLREWSDDLSIEEVNFGRSIFFIQIHGLPPRLISERNARRIGASLGSLRETGDSLVVAHRFLRIRVEISVEDPLPVGFKQTKEGGQERWIQFRIEKLSDFCFKCGMLSHLIGQCCKQHFEMVHLNTGVEARKFGKWLHTERKGDSSLFKTQNHDAVSLVAASDRKPNLQCAGR